MEKIAMGTITGVYETFILYILYGRILGRKENTEKIFVLLNIILAVILFISEIADRNIIVTAAAVAMELIYGTLLFAGGIYRKLYYGIIYGLAVISGHQIYEILNNVTVNTTGKPVSFVYGDIIFVEIIISLLVLFMIRQNQKIEGAEQDEEVFKTFSIVPVSSLLLVISIYDGEMYKNASRENQLFFAAALFIAVISNVAVQGMTEKYSAAKYREYISGLKEIRSEMENKYFKRVEKSNREYMELMHNIRNHFSVINGMTGDNDRVQSYLRDIDVRLNSVSKVMYTSNHIFNAILSEKKEAAMQKGILCEIKADRNVRTWGIPDTDIIEITGNIMDNAIEALEKVEDADKRKITVRSYMCNEDKFFVLTVENYSENMPKITDGKYVTSKKDKEKHGIGIESVRRMAEKNEGYVDIVMEKNIFRVTVTMPVKRK